MNDRHSDVFASNSAWLNAVDSACEEGRGLLVLTAHHVPVWIFEDDRGDCWAIRFPDEDDPNPTTRNARALWLEQGPLLLLWDGRRIPALHAAWEPIVDLATVPRVDTLR